MISQTEICVIATLRILYSIRKYCIPVKKEKKKQIEIDREKKFLFHVFTSTVRLRALKWCYTWQFATTISVAMLEQCCNHSKQYCNDVATLYCAKNRRCELSRVTSPLTTTTATAAKTSLLKWIRAFPNFAAFISIFLKMSNVGQFSWTWIFGDHTQV